MADKTAPWRDGLSRLAAIPFWRQYGNPNGRAEFILDQLRDFIVGTKLEVGSGRNAPIFRRALGASYCAADMGGSYHLPRARGDATPDVVVDLERGSLPFADQSFDTVICTDVLEHLECIHAMYDELFRVSRKHVVVSLPNNWPGMMGSFLAGKNISHQAGYGLAAEPKVPGQRHKHFFNLEEAYDFLVGRLPSTHRAIWIGPRFEYGTDGILCSSRKIALLFRAVKSREKVLEHLGRRKGQSVWLLAHLPYLPLRLVDVIVSGLLWGWGSPVRYHNLFCRQAWIVFARK